MFSETRYAMNGDHYFAEHRREWKIIFSELLGEDASTVRWSFFDDMQITVGGKKS